MFSSELKNKINKPKNQAIFVTLKLLKKLAKHFEQKKLDNFRKSTVICIQEYYYYAMCPYPILET